MIRNLHELCNIQYGYAFDSASFTDDASYTPLVRIRDVKRGYSETYYSGAYSDEYIIRAGDLLVGMDGEFNAAKWKSRDALLNQRVCKIIAKKETDGEYLRFALSVALKIIEERTAFVTVKHLSVKELNKIKIQAPSYEEQKNIAGILLRIEEIIQAKRDELRKLDSLIKARFVEMFKDEDPVFAFDDVLIDDTKNGFKLDSSNYSNLGKIAIVDQGQKRICGYINAVDGKAPWSKEAIIFGDHTEMFKYINFPFYLGADGAKLLSPKNGWNARFLYHYLDVNYHKRLGYMRHFKYLKEMSFIKPDLYRQEEFCMFCTQVDKSKFALSNELAMGNFYIRLIHDCIMHGCIDL